MLFGLGIGLVVAAWVWLDDAAPPATVANIASNPASAAAQRTAPVAEQDAAAPGEPVPTRERFDFYEILPQFEVVVPEVETPAGRPAPARPVEEPGSYVLQAGSFSALADADRMQASLALLGVESRIQRVTIDDSVFHRVRIGPLRDLDELNRIRRRLRDASVDTLLMKVPQ